MAAIQSTQKYTKDSNSFILLVELALKDSSSLDCVHCCVLCVTIVLLLLHVVAHFIK
eukprot:m.380351 g.380351  ORF g.380351 m.380351 type:complete len:57 (-) comp105300_c0_seq1:38-208(-)